MKKFMYYNFLEYSKLKKKKKSILIFKTIKAHYDYLFKKKTTARFTSYGDEILKLLRI